MLRDPGPFNLSGRELILRDVFVEHRAERLIVLVVDVGSEVAVVLLLEPSVRATGLIRELVVVIARDPRRFVPEEVDRTDPGMEDLRAWLLVAPGLGVALDHPIMSDDVLEVR